MFLVIFTSLLGGDLLTCVARETDHRHRDAE
jgi:hypothetical protein